MTNIEKLYELANVKKIGKKYSCDALDFGACKNPCCGCSKAKIKNYPPFTAEKQLELIKRLATTRQIHITNICGDWMIEGMVRYGKKYKDFSQALAGLVCELWEDLTPEQREEIRRILQ